MQLYRSNIITTHNDGPVYDHVFDAYHQLQVITKHYYLAQINAPTLIFNLYIKANTNQIKKTFISLYLY